MSRPLAATLRQLQRLSQRPGSTEAERARAAAVYAALDAAPKDAALLRAAEDYIVRNL